MRPLSGAPWGAGVALVTTYPGTPASEIGDRCYEISRQTDLQFEFSTNEKVALEVAAGAAAAAGGCCAP